MEAKEKVMQWIEKNFEVSKVSLKDYPLLPGGVVLTDSNNESMYIFYDLLNECVMYSFPETKGFKRG